MTKATEKMIEKAATEDLSATQWRDLLTKWREEIYSPKNPWHSED
jgi:hypothetical protein